MDLKKLVVPGHRGRAARRDGLHVPRRRGAQDADRPLPADHLDLRGQRRPGPRSADRDGRHRDAVRHRRDGDDVVRRRGQGPRGRQGRHRLAVDRRRPLRPAHPRLDRRTGAGRRCDAPDRPHGGAARARPDLPEPRRPHRRARPQRRERQGRAHRPARDHGGELRWPGGEVPPDHPGPQPAHRDPRRQQGGALRLGGGPGGADPHAGPQRLDRAAVQPVARLGLGDARGGARPSSPRRCATWPSR